MSGFESSAAAVLFHVIVNAALISTTAIGIEMTEARGNVGKLRRCFSTSANSTFSAGVS